jgi:hypothetical protein
MAEPVVDFDFEAGSVDQGAKQGGRLDSQQPVYDIGDRYVTAGALEEDDLMRSPDENRSQAPRSVGSKAMKRPKRRPFQHYARKNEQNKNDEVVKRSCFDEAKGQNCPDCEETLLFNQKSEQEFLDEKLRKIQADQEAKQQPAWPERQRRNEKDRREFETHRERRKKQL